MRLLALLLFLVCGASNAAPLACLPSTVGGTGTKHVYEWNAVGGYLAWYCPTETTGHQFWWHWAEAPANWTKLAADALKAGKPAIDAYAEQVALCQRAPNGGCFTPADLDGVIQPGFKQFAALFPAQTATWKVKPPGPRVVYTLVAGKRGPLTNPVQYVAAGTSCDPSIRVDEPLLKLTYMGVPGGIAVCEFK